MHSCQLSKLFSNEIWSYLVATRGVTMFGSKGKLLDFDGARLTRKAFLNTLISS